MKRLVILFFVANFLAVKPEPEKNTCKTIIDYIFKGSGCTYNPDVDANMPQLVKNHNYPVEEYHITTKDGYILTVFRLPRKNPKGVMFLLHPATASCTVWVDKGPTESLGLVLFNAGYDVWLGNSRGTFYSRNHTRLNPDLNEFWDFSYHEMAIYDLPSTIELISTKSKSENITFIGHSMSATAAVIYAALMPEHATKYVSVFILNAPMVYTKHMRTPLKYFSWFADPIYKLFETFGSLEAMPLNRDRWINQFCGSNFIGIKQCVSLVQIFFGPDSGIQNYPQIPVMWGQNPAGLSLKCTYHYAQSITAKGQFRYFDYGKTRNIQRYNSTEPPLYPLQNIRSSFYLIVGSNDYIVDKKDVIQFQNDLPESTMKMKIKVINGYNHGHFAYGKNLNKDLFTPILKFIVDWKKGNITPYQ